MFLTRNAIEKFNTELLISEKKQIIFMKSTLIFRHIKSNLVAFI